MLLEYSYPALPGSGARYPHRTPSQPGTFREDTQGPVTVVVIVSDIRKHSGVQGDYRARNVLTIEVAVEEMCLLILDRTLGIS